MKYKRMISLSLGVALVMSGCASKSATNEAKPVEAKTPVKIVKEVKKNKPIKNRQQVDTTSWIDVKKPAHLPILMYHSISKGNGNSLRVPKEKFAQEMKWLKDHGYYTLSPAETYAVLTQGKKPREKCVLITLDDGYVDNYYNAYPILQRYDMKATVFMIGNAVGAKNHLTKQQLMDMHQHGISIESHTIHHWELNRLRASLQRNELIHSKHFLDRLFQQNTIMLSYPSGRYNAETLRLAEQSGYKMAVTTKPGSASSSQGMFTLHRIRVTPGMSVQGFGRIVDRANE